MKRSVLWLFSLLLCLLFSAARTESHNRALLVGCDHFLTQSDTAPCSEENVTMMAEALRGGLMNLQREVILKTGIAGKDQLLQQIKETFAGATDEDVSYLYFSTHGIWETPHTDFSMTLLLSDGLHEEGLTAEELHAWLEEIPGKKVLILDVCHAGAMIGKGVAQVMQNLFEGDHYKVLCSSGGDQASWFWKGVSLDGSEFTGGGYFSSILSDGLSLNTNYAADENEDGEITLSEIKRYLQRMHGASLVQSYPEEDDFVFLSYDPQTVYGRQKGPIGDVSFEEKLLGGTQMEVRFSYTVFQTLRMAYQIVYQKDGQWDFEHATIFYDTGEMTGAYGDAAGYLIPGIKERSIQLDSVDETAQGYVLVQLLVQSSDKVQVAASHVLGVASSGMKPEIAVRTGEHFSPEKGEELAILVEHHLPMQLTLLVENEEGKVVRRLQNRVMTRPEQILPEASSFYWSGKDQDGTVVEHGTYHIRVRAYLHESMIETVSEPFTLGDKND